MKLLRITTVPLSLKYLLRGQLKYFASLGYEVIAVSSDGPERNEFIQEEHIPHHIIPLSRKITPFQDIRCIILLYQLIKKEKPLIVHSHTPKAGLIGMIAAFLAKVPIRLHTVAGLPLMEASGLKRNLLLVVERVIYRLATGIYPNSFALKTYIEETIYSKAEKIKVIAEGSSNGIDTDYFSRTEVLENCALEIRKEANVSVDEMVGIFVGRITGDKGINELVRSIRGIENLKLFLVGPFEPELDPLKEDVIEEIHTNPNIHWFGFQSDVRPYLMASDFLVFPSYREGFPNVPMQAGALGLPSIVTDINGCNEIIKDGVNGLLIPVKDEPALKKAILRMKDEKLVLSHMQKRSRKIIIEKYDRQIVWDALEKEYLELTQEYV